MSSNNTTKKRKVDNDESGISMAAVLAEMQEMKSKLSRMDELESQCISMQNEMDSMKSELSRVDDIKSELDSMQSEMDSSKISMQNEMKKMQITIDNKQSQIDKLENKCMHLESKCGSYEKSIELLTKEKRWRFSAPEIPQSYWLEDQGFDMDYTRRMEELLKDIENTSTWLRSGECIAIALNHSIINNETDILQHDDKLLPYWMELANAIQVHPNSEQLEKLAMDNMELPTSVLKLLSPALKGKTIQRCRFINNTFDSMSDGIEFAVGLIKGLASMKRFDWINIVIEDEEHINDLVEAIINNPSIVDFQLEHSLGDGVNGYAALSTLLASDKRWKFIDLEGNNIKTEGDIAIPDYIANNPPLNHLYLANNNLNDNDAILIANALKNNTNLLEIRLGDISNIGKEALLKAVYDPTSLNSLTDCNHSCTIEGISFDHRNTDNDYDDGSEANKSKKIYHLLSIRNREGSNVQHLNEEFAEDKDDSLTLKLVPKFLEFISQFDRPDRSFVHSLSIVYEILRGWKMPELYDTKRGYC